MNGLGLGLTESKGRVGSVQSSAWIRVMTHLLQLGTELCNSRHFPHFHNTWRAFLIMLYQFFFSFLLFYIFGNNIYQFPKAVFPKHWRVQSESGCEKMEVVRSHWKSIADDVIVSTLPLYRSAPSLEVRLEDFELFAIDRLRGRFLSLLFSLFTVFSGFHLFNNDNSRTCIFLPFITVVIPSKSSEIRKGRKNQKQFDSFSGGYFPFSSDLFKKLGFWA